MLLISRFMNLWTITCISSLLSTNKFSFSSFPILSFLLQLPISSSVSQIIKELCSSSSSSYPFHFRHLPFNNITKGNFFLKLTNPIITIILHKLHGHISEYFNRSSPLWAFAFSKTFSHLSLFNFKLFKLLSCNIYTTLFHVTRPSLSFGISFPLFRFGTASNNFLVILSASILEKRPVNFNTLDYSTYALQNISVVY